MCITMFSISKGNVCSSSGICLFNL
jgi:hypothetical protein